MSIRSIYAYSVLCLLQAIAAAQATPRFAPLRNYEMPLATQVANLRAAADIDGDGDMDLLMSQFLRGGPCRVLINSGVGRFFDGTASRLPTGPGGGAIETGDVDGDGDVDILVGVVPFFGTPGQVWLLTNDGTGRFRNASGTQLPASTRPTNSFDIRLFDVDGDRDLDLLVLNTQPGNANFYINDGKGVFKEERSLVPDIALTSPRQAHPRDFDGDGDLDVVITGARTMIWINHGGRFMDETSSRLPTVSGLTWVTALDADSDSDHVIVVSIESRHELWINDGKGVFSRRAGRIPLATNALFSAADADRDGDIDLIVFEPAGPRLLANDGAGQFTEVWHGPRTEYIGMTGVVFDADRDGDVDIAISGLQRQGTKLELLAGLHRQLNTPAPPRVGRTLTYRVYAEPGYATADMDVFIWLARGRIPSITLPPLGNFGLDPSTCAFFRSVRVPRSVGHVNVTLQVPNDPSLEGAKLFAQGGWKHGASPMTWRFGNLQRDTVVR